MILAVDLDGVLYEWERTARYMLRTFRGCSNLSEESKGWDWIQERVSDSDWRWLWGDGVTRGLFRYGHMVTGARIGLEALRDSRHDIKIVTHRPASAISDTLDWLSLYLKDIPLAGVHILSNGEPKDSVKADVLIDDKPKNVVRWTGGAKDAILFRRPWNQNWDGSLVHTAHGWDEVVQIVRALDE